MGNTSSDNNCIEQTNCVQVPTNQTHSCETPDTLATPSDQSSNLSAMTPITPNTSLTSISSFPNIRVTKLAERVVSDRIAEIAAKFWCQNIETCSMKDRLEIACSVWFGMISSDTEILRLSKQMFENTTNLETLALKSFEMVGFIIRAKCSNNNNIASVLYKLGTVHNKMGIKPKYYGIMLKNINDSFKFYFPQKYTHSVQFAVNEIFSYATQIMTGCDLNIQSKLTDISFLDSLRFCVGHDIGSKYLFRYLHQKYCDEMVIFLYLLRLFKNSTNLQKRYIIVEQIKDICINANGCFAVNISFELREKILLKMSKFDKCDAENMSMETDFFVDIEDEIYSLIMQCHWKKFKTQINQILLIS